MNQHTRMEAPLPFIDVAAQRRRLGSRIDDAIARVVNHCQFINGPEVRELERDLSAFCGAKHSIGVSSGTDALVLILMALGVGKGDAVFCPAFTFSATAESVALVGATPVFVDVLEATFNLDPASLERGIATAKRLELKPKAVMAVDLFGLPADYDAIGRIAQKHDLKVIDDAAQSFGATYRNRKVGMLGDVTATSFFPAKPLGCYGDGGAVFTDDDDLAALILQPAQPRRGRGPLRQCAHRHERAARHDPGGGADREAEDLRRRDRDARPRGEALQRAARRHRDRAAGAVRLRLGVGAVHDPACRPGSAIRSPPRCAARAFRPRSIIPSPRTGRPPTAIIRWPTAGCR